MANIRDIARLTGYSVSTVSRVINQHPYVSEEKRQHILRVMKELNYIPNSTARQLSYGKTKNIGVIIPFTNHPYFDQLLSGITKAAFESQYKVTLLPTNYDSAIETDYLDQFAAKEFDGLIITSRANAFEKILSYQQYGPIIFCEDLDEENIGCVFIDRERSIREGLLYLLDQGCQKIGVTLGRSGKLSKNSKITVRLCQELLPNFQAEDILWDCLDFADGQRAGNYFANKGVDGIFTNGDGVAAGIVDTLEEAAPLLVGRDNLIISKFLNITTIDHHLPLCGEYAFKLFITNSQEHLRVPYTFIKRNAL